VRLLAWIKKVPAWAWIAVVAVGLIVTTVTGWRRAAARCAAALEKARSAEAALAIEKEAAEEHAKVAEELQGDLDEIDEEAELELDGLDEKVDTIEKAESDADGSLADLANEHFGNKS
jgi:Flp pilus assembly protein TadB